MGEEPKQPGRRAAAGSEPPKVRATLYLSAEVLNEARNAAVHLAGYPARLTLTKLAETRLALSCNDSRIATTAVTIFRTGPRT